jgi:hypothetical protein
MATRSASVLGACLIACCLVLGHYFGRAAEAEPVRAAAPAAGRYLLATTGKDGNTLVLLDTATGQCWWRFLMKAPGAEWEDRAPPVAGKAGQ